MNIMLDRNPQTDKKIRLYGVLICLVVFTAYFLAFFHRVSPSVLALDMQQDFGVGAALMGHWVRPIFIRMRSCSSPRA